MTKGPSFCYIRGYFVMAIMGFTVAKMTPEEQAKADAGQIV